MTRYYSSYTDEELITEGQRIVATPLERELAGRLAEALDTVALYKSEMD